MRLLSLNVIPQSVCNSPPCAKVSLGGILNAPPIVRVPGLDDVGVEYGFDLQLTEGAYVLLAFAVVWSVALRPVFLELIRRHREHE